MSSTIAKILPTPSQTSGIGFLNPGLLPDFRTSLRNLHLMRRDPIYSGWNRKTLSQVPILNNGADFRATEVYSATRGTFIEIDDIPVNYQTGFTFAMALRWDTFPQSGEPIIESKDNSFSPNRGFTLRSTGAASPSVVWRCGTAGGRGMVNRSIPDMPTANYSWWFISFDRDDVRVLLAHSDSVAVSDVNFDSSAGFEDPDPEAGFRFFQGSVPQSSVDDPDTAGMAAFAYWDEGLDIGQMRDEYANLKSWSASVGIDLTPETF